jgi:signal peptidase I
MVQVQNLENPLVSNAAATAAETEQKPAIDSRREIVETVAVVLALVSLLRMFVAEAFSIPTGSMGPTLLGANRRIECPQCSHVSIVGAYTQASGGPRLAGAICQNCRYPIFTEPRSLNALLGEYGDRVIVSKYGYEFGDPKRWDVVVFIYPAEAIPEQNSYPSRTNFIKRLVGMPGEEVAFMYGDAYVRKKGEKEFAIASKTPKAMMATRRVVFDNDEQPKDLVKIGYPSRWNPVEGAKISEDRKRFTIDGDGALLYLHLIGGGHRDVLPRAIPRAVSMTPQLVTDFESYNRPYGSPFNQPADDFSDLVYIDVPDPAPAFDGASINWVGDLMIEATLDMQALGGSFTLQLSEAERKYRCEFTFDGDKKLRLFQGTKQLAEIANPVTAPRTVDVRFANFDDRLVVWIDDELVFGDGVPVAALEPEENGPTKNDLEPAKLTFSKLRGEVRHLKLYRDIYYTQESRLGDEQPSVYPIGPEDEGAIAVWQKGLQQSMSRIRNLTRNGQPNGRERIFHIPDGHYMMCGDNSPRSFDGRGWGLTSFVPRRCVLGKALVVYYPLNKLPWKLKLVQ